MRRIINKLFVAVIVFSLTFTALPLYAFSQDDSGSCGENVTYEYDGTKKVLHITGSGKMTDYASSSDVPCLASTLVWQPATKRSPGPFLPNFWCRKIAKKFGAAWQEPKPLQ